MSTRHKNSGISLIELIMFIVIVSVALAGILLVMNQVTRGSADPLIRKQALAVAESLLEEVALMPFTFCAQNDANATTAASAVVGPGGCATTLEGMGPEAGEDRYSAITPFDNVNDYADFPTMASGAILDITGNYIGLAGYDATIEVLPFALGAIPATEALQITVIVNGPGGESVVLDGIRTRHSPN